MFIHLWSQFTPNSPEADARHALARSSWERLRWIDVPVVDESLPRLFNEGRKRLPYIRDLFDAGVRALQDPSDIVVFSNSDIGFCEDAVVRIAFFLQTRDAGEAFRRDIPPRTTLPTDDEVMRGVQYCGSDVFFFRGSWWTQHRGRFPDVLIGREAWDACMRVLIDLTNAEKPISLPDICWHVRHSGGSHWEATSNRYTLPGQIHNLTLAKQFMQSCRINPAVFGIR